MALRNETLYSAVGLPEPKHETIWALDQRIAERVERAKRRRTVGAVVSAIAATAVVGGLGVATGWHTDHEVTKMVNDKTTEAQPAATTPVTEVLVAGRDGDTPWEMARNYVGPEANIDSTLNQILDQAADNNHQPGFQPGDFQVGDEFIIKK